MKYALESWEEVFQAMKGQLKDCPKTCSGILQVDYNYREGFVTLDSPMFTFASNMRQLAEETLKNKNIKYEIVKENTMLTGCVR